MKLILITLLLALGWGAATGNFGLPNLILGGLVGAACLWLIRGRIGGRKFWRRGLRILALIALFLKELTVSAVRVGLLVLRPRLVVRPVLLAYPLSVTSDAGITLLANMITLTPGTLSVDLSADRKFLLIHAIDGDRDAVIREIRDGLERKVMELDR